MSDYSTADIKAALDSLPLERGDVVFCHANLGFFGRAEGISGADDLCEMFFDAIMARVGPNGTLCVPTFTYSFSRPEPEIFYVTATPSKMGMFAEWVRLSGALRSLDPSYSIAAVGSQDETLVHGLSENSFDSGASFFERFEAAEGKVLNLNCDAGSTYVHYVERELRVPYRFDKTFEGVIAGLMRPARSTIFVHYRDEALVARFEAFDALAREREMFKTAKLGRGEMGVISAYDTSDLIAETLPSRPWFLTKAEVMGVTPDPAKFSELR